MAKELIATIAALLRGKGGGGNSSMEKQASTMLPLVRDRAGETAQAKGEVLQRGLPLTSGAIPFCVAQETSLAWETLVKWPWSIFFDIFANSEIDQKIDFTLKPRLGAFFGVSRFLTLNRDRFGIQNGSPETTVS